MTTYLHTIHCRRRLTSWQGVNATAHIMLRHIEAVKLRARAGPDAVCTMYAALAWLLEQPLSPMLAEMAAGGPGLPGSMYDAALLVQVRTLLGVGT